MLGADGELTPVMVGAGRWIVSGLLAAVDLAPQTLRQRLKAALQPVAAPLPAYLFRADIACLAQST